MESLFQQITGLEVKKEATFQPLKSGGVSEKLRKDVWWPNINSEHNLLKASSPYKDLGKIFVRCKISHSIVWDYSEEKCSDC